MLYQVGSKIDISSVNPPKKTSRQATAERFIAIHDKYIAGTKISFMTMTKGLLVMSVVEPPTMLNVSIG